MFPLTGRALRPMRRKCLRERRAIREECPGSLRGWFQSGRHGSPCPSWRNSFSLFFSKS